MRPLPFRPAIWIIGLAILASFASPDPALAYRTAADLPEFAGFGPVAWEETLIPFELQGEPPRDLSVYGTRQGINEAFTTWTRVTCSDAVPSLMGSSEAPVASGDGVNGITFIREGWATMGFDPDAAATSDVHYRVDESSSAGFIVEADLYINAESYRWGLASAGEGVRDLVAVVTHETGHLLGLLHLCETDGAEAAPLCSTEHQMSTLYPEYLGLSQRELGDDDIDGLCWLYPNERACPMTPCADGLTCVEGLCMLECGESGCGPCGGAECPSEVGDPCVSADDCHDGFCSAEGACTRGCAFDSDCPGDFECEEGECSPGRRGVYGDACANGDQCASRLCLLEGAEGTAGVCTRHCADGSECPTPDLCSVVDGMPVCEAPGDGGCAVGGSPIPTGTPVGIASSALRFTSFTKANNAPAPSST